MEARIDDIYQQIKENVVSSLDYTKDISDEEMYELIDNELSSGLRHLALSVNDRKRLRQQIFHSIRKLDVLQQLVDDPSVTEIMINGVDNLFIEKDGVISKFDGRFESREKLEDVVQQIVASCNRVVNESWKCIEKCKP